MNTINSHLDLNKIKQIIFQDIFKLLDSFNLEYTQDKDNIFMRCPIHEGSDNPNGLSISLDRQVWRCWTRGCHEHYGYNIWGLIQGLLDTESFSDALRYICKLYNIKNNKELGFKNDNIIDINDDNDLRMFSDLVSKFAKSKLQTKKTDEDINKSEIYDAKCNSEYFISRGFKEETLRFFDVRDAKQDARSIIRHRAIIPIMDCENRYVGWIGRSTRDFIHPKYIFSRGFKKSHHLYNYYNAIQYINKMSLSALFLVEGQGDVWKLWECGVKNSVSLFGKDISAEQKKLLLQSGATKLVILTDNDQAGRESKIKIKRDLGRLFKLIFPRMHTKDLGNMAHDIIQKNILNSLKGYY